ncbi:MAG: beta-lactamase family protein [Tatlockia sp.]|nr:beta-lactamase family protein [Tatlockia sp.]
MNSDKYDELFEIYNRGDNPGIAILIIKNQRIILKKGYGLKNLKDYSPIDSNSNFNLASLSKAFTAAAIALLEEQGLICLEDSIKKFFKAVSPEYEAIKIKHLIYHLSGLPHFAKEHWDKKKLITNKKIINYLKQHRLETIPGEKFMYNDSGYILLASIIEKVTTISYPQFLKNFIFVPCGMKNTLACPDKTLVPERALGYSEWPLFELDDTYPGDLVYGDGAIYSSLEDLYAWILAIEQDKLFLPATKQKLFSTGYRNNHQPAFYGYGWFISEERGAKLCYHAGEWVGFRHWIANIPSQKLWILVLSNSSGTNARALGEKLRSI